ncbi:hypothetical protein KIN20_017269 [Parelaphostrongylus tenuis]|uniref:Uncharacterized protein n=1 Tax=Parelaphostrongylus tenuis TaxID=148309 RepID=A0AAD5MZQ5_PARTN|nr:hypothetical protein KIN20_017269 [Parelaphostrongylus tenuis]
MSSIQVNWCNSLAAVRFETLSSPTNHECSINAQHLERLASHSHPKQMTKEGEQMLNELRIHHLK